MVLIFGQNAKENWYPSPEKGMRKQRQQGPREQSERTREGGPEGQDQDRRAEQRELTGVRRGVRRDTQEQDSGGGCAHITHVDTPPGRKPLVMGCIVELTWRGNGLISQ